MVEIIESVREIERLVEKNKTLVNEDDDLKMLFDVNNVLVILQKYKPDRYV